MSYLEDIIKMQTALVTFHEHSVREKSECNCRYCRATREFLKTLEAQKKGMNHVAN